MEELQSVLIDALFLSIRFGLPLMIHTLIVAALSILLLRVWPLYAYRLVLWLAPFAVGVLYGQLAAPDNPTLRDWVSLIVGPAVLAPFFSWLFYRKRLTAARLNP